MGSLVKNDGITLQQKQVYIKVDGQEQQKKDARKSHHKLFGERGKQDFIHCT
jgi:hypothetical protein